MKNKNPNPNPNEILFRLIERYPELESCHTEILAAYHSLKNTYAESGKVLVAGNGGSAADSEHIVGELMKSFLFKRKIDSNFYRSLVDSFGDSGEILANKLEGSLPTIALTSMPALTSAISNDVDPEVTFAQLVYGYGNKGDAFVGISTSGNSKNIINALMVAKMKDMRTIALTGRNGGKCNGLCDYVIHAPAEETFEIQEYHLPIYHALCAMLEANFFE
jgi:D-sedoheptulose 7-phosphate isomerase